MDELEEVIIYVDGDSARCSGEYNDHPLVFYNVPPEGYAVCHYCNIKFMRKKK